MRQFFRWVAISAGLFCLSLMTAPGSPKPVKSGTEVVAVAGKGPAVLWQEPRDINTRNLLYGSGGQAGQPRGPFTFIKEDLGGSNPKFDVTDRNGTKWKVKMGVEARPETVASRLVWAVGYFSEDDYFVPVARVEGMPRLRRGRKYVEAGGTVYNVRLKREADGEKKIGTWKWAKDPFTGTREFNGLRVLMALIDNWDLKDENNTILELPGGHPEQIYLVSDLGASFARTGFGWTRRGSKGNLKAYEHSKFLKRVAAETVTFYVPSRPALDHFPDIPDLKRRLGLRWIGRDIPRADARWMGDLLDRLSDAQIKDAFRAAQYSEHDIDGFSRVVEERIRRLRQL